ncbi:MAG: thiolase family protein [Chloroflexota bacterium]
MEDIVIVDGVRTAIGTLGGSFSDTSVSELGSIVVREVLQRAGLAPEHVDQVILGNVGGAPEDAYFARNASLKAGLPIEVPALAVSRACGSGLEAIHNAARWIQAGDAEVVVAGGAENMTRIPYYLRKARTGYRYGNDVLEDGVQALLTDPNTDMIMGITAENLAAKFELSRQVQDEYALRSQERAAHAIEAGYFDSQIVPVEVRKGREKVMFAKDEHPRATNMETLAKLRPVFKADGDVPAGTSSGINDGAAAVIVTTASKAKELGLRPRLRLLSKAVSGVDPTIMGSGPIPASQAALKRANLTVDDMDVIELNEAFASVAAACSLGLNLPLDKTNPNGGAIALGHPVGATGAILTVKVMNELERTGGRYGLVTLCIGGGQGIAAVFERIS